MLVPPSWYRDDQGDSPQNLESLIRERWKEARRAR
jgi:hypothetical protein